MKRVIIMLTCFLIVIGSGCAKKVEEIDETSYQEILQEVELENVIVRNQKTVWDEMHKMANTKILAEHIWGEIEITEEKVNKLLTEVMASDYSDKKQLLAILDNWKNGDFGNAVNEHNYLWDKLGGTVGKAYDLRE